MRICGVKKRCTGREDRDEKIIIFYEILIKRHGVYSARLKKQEFYNEVGDMFNITGETAGRIIRKMLRKKIKDKQYATRQVRIMTEIDNIVKKFKEMEE